jgi:Flavodoxin-like fold
VFTPARFSRVKFSSWATAEPSSLDGGGTDSSSSDGGGDEAAAAAVAAAADDAAAAAQDAPSVSDPTTDPTTDPTISDLYEEYPTFDINVQREQELLLAHDIIVFQHPFYWQNKEGQVRNAESFSALQRWRRHECP